MSKRYIVLYPFRDLQDKNKDFPNGKVYAIGDIYSNKASKERLEELSTKNNKLGRELIKISNNLDELTVKELIGIAKDKKIENYSTMKKEELIKAIEGE